MDERIKKIVNRKINETMSKLDEKLKLSDSFEDQIKEEFQDAIENFEDKWNLSNLDDKIHDNVL